MKPMLICFLILSVVFQQFSNCNFFDGNNIERGLQDEYNNITEADLVLNGFHLGDEKEKIILRLGQPDSVNKILNEFEGSFFDVCYYGYSELHFVNNKFESFVVLDTKFNLVKFDVAIGDSAVKLKKQFPKSFSEEENSDKQEKLVRILIQNTDSYLIFTYQRDVIVRFEKWNSN